MQNASQNNKIETPSAEKPFEDRRKDVGPAAGAAGSDDLVMHIAHVAALADQCDKEGNPATAIALRRVAEALWGDAFRHHSKANSDK
jgi:hypothetical protein